MLAFSLAVALAAGPLAVSAAEAGTKTHKTAETSKTAKKATAKKKTASKKKTGKKSKKKKSHAAAAPVKRHLATVTSTLLTKADIAAITDAFNEADRKNWPEAMRHMKRLNDPAAAKLILWSRLVAPDSGATLAEITAFQEQNPDWPRQALLTRRAEEALLAYPMSNQDMIGWFSAHPPLTGEGKIRFGQALIGAGQKEQGKTWIQRAWAEDDFEPVRQKEILANFRSYFTPAVHKARLDRLLWDKRTADAKTTAALIGEDAQALAEARIRLMTRSNTADDAVARLPRSMKSDVGLLFDRIRYERKRGNDEATVPLILTAPAKPHQMIDVDAWWVERKIAARVALAEGQYKEAYAIVSRHGLEDGSDYADAEFLCGWIALQYLNKPGDALAHFLRLKDAVTTPISKARAEYWSARAASAQGDKKVAELYYRLAAHYPTTFYGQLGTVALASLGEGDARLKLPKDPTPSASEKAEFKKLELVHVAQILHDLGRDDQAWSFMLHLADILEEPQQLAQLSDMALAFNDRKLSLRVAKTAAQRNMLLPQRAYPVSYMPAYAAKGPPVEKALVYGLSRQESEFDPGAMSPVGARGLMQLMPATARTTARQISVPYSASRLTSDPAYNAMLGSAHLGDLIDGYSGSYVMSIAAYNAGATRVSEWQGLYGDPRSTAVDPIDWIENIPFSETRNYVQRVMENLEIYRTRLNGSAQKIRLSEDIRRNTGAPIATAAPVPGKIPLASPLLPASVMEPVAEKEEQLADAQAKSANDLTAAPENNRMPLAPKRGNAKR
ncbi:MAG TPA: lytic transglycosylase domain-containing protein [Parvibaculum sp.]